MSTLDHPHIIHLEEVYEDDEEFSFVLELAKAVLSFLFPICILQIIPIYFLI